MFKRQPSDSARTITFSFKNKPIQANTGDTIAAALLANGINSWRITAVKKAPRGPWCMMGACYDCLIEIDGVTLQACMTEVEKGSVVMPIAGFADGKDD